MGSKRSEADHTTLMELGYLKTQLNAGVRCDLEGSWQKGQIVMQHRSPAR